MIDQHWFIKDGIWYGTDKATGDVEVVNTNEVEIMSNDPNAYDPRITAPCHPDDFLTSRPVIYGAKIKGINLDDPHSEDWNRIENERKMERYQKKIDFLLAENSSLDNQLVAAMHELDELRTEKVAS